MKTIAIVGPTASGKTGLAIETAKQTNSIILSLDSLSVYKEIDIASAKPTEKERDGIVHFGIDEVTPDKNFDVMEFIDCYKRAAKYCKDNDKNLIIVGGTGFYLKSMIDGLSPNIKPSQQTAAWVNEQLKNRQKAYSTLLDIDPKYAKSISQNDSYRIEKALLIYKQSGMPVSKFFELNPKKPIIKDIDIYEIVWDSEELRERIRRRTKQMIKEGLIDEVIYLEKKYGRLPNAMGSIGIIETLEYLDGKINKSQLEEKIATNTARLAKRQRTFNRTQFENLVQKSLQELKEDLIQSKSINNYCHTNKGFF